MSTNKPSRQPSTKTGDSAPQSDSATDGQSTDANTKADAPQSATLKSNVKEYGGPKGPEPTRYGDWEKNGRCSDF